MPAGRPRQFDLDHALDEALYVFWRKGYEGTSLPDLTEAMGINRPSLYAAFGNKEELFKKVLDRYAEGRAKFLREALTETSARKVTQRFLDGVVELLSDPHNPRGCLVVQGALACGDDAKGIRKELAGMRKTREALLRARFERAQKEGDLPPGTTAATLARYLITVAQGMAVQASDGASKAELAQTAALAMCAWAGVGASELAG